ncbi:MAG TPA: glycosyltransferase [bacterium]|nr:glycosyltransferase [bacterium]
MAKSIYRTLVPFGSRRDRFLWITLVTIRKLREGPGPWLRAVRKGIYQLLPTRWQQRILRWTGRDELGRRAALRPADAAAGVERPGLVSVVLPVFDQADMVAQAIDSVLAQTYAPFELIVVDDGSRDDLHAVLQRYLADPRVHCVTQPNQGLPKALTTGFEHARGEFFTWTSADNRMHPDQLTRLVAFLRERPDVAMVYADYELIDERGELLQGGEFRVMDRTDKRNLSVVRINRSTHDLNRYEDNFIGACFLYRAGVGRLLGDYNPELGLEDYDYWMRINRLFRIEHLGSDDVLYQYRVHDNTLSARARQLRIAERAKVLMQYERDRAAWFARTLAEQAYEVAPEQLADLPTANREPLACWFDDCEQVHRAHAQLRHLPVIAFARDDDVAARLAVHTRLTFRGVRDEATVELAKRFAANHSFFHATRDSARLQRAVPMPLAQPDQQPLRVLLQVETFGNGGLERVALDLAECWQRAGCEVGVLALHGVPASLPPGVQSVHLARRDDASYAAMLAQGRWHAISAHASTFGADVANARGVPFVQVVHNSYVWLDRVDIERYRRADEHTHAYVCVSAQALGYADLRLQLDVQKMLVIENGVAAAADPASSATTRDEFGFVPDDFVFLHVASLQPAKAHLCGLHALARLRQEQPRAKLLCLGDDRMHPLHAAKVRSEISRLGLDDAVVLAGHRADIADCYALADAFFLPSFWEGCSLAVWEAIRHRLPLALADVGAAREQLHHGRGRLVAPPFPSMFALDADNLPALLAGDHDDYAARLAEAMREVLDLPRPDQGLPTIAHRETMAHRHLLLLRWLRQGGEVPAIRASIARAATAFAAAGR